jgi:hypothetical protein
MAQGMSGYGKFDEECFKHFIQLYKQQWDLNQYFRDEYDEDLEYYLGYRNETRYPLAYNISFNKILPRILQTMSRFMDQLYQPASHNLVSVRPRKRSDVERAPRVEGLLNFQLETLNEVDSYGGSYLFNFKWMFDACAWGTGIAKLYWKKEDRIAPKRIQIPVPQFDPYGRLVGLRMLDQTVQMPQIVYDGPAAEVIHPKTFVPHPHYKDIQKMPAVFCVYKRPFDYLIDQERKGIYRNVRKVGWGGQDDANEAFAKSIEIEGALTAAEIESERITKDVDIIEGYGRYIFPEDESPYEVDSGYKIKGRESEAIVHIANYKTLLSIQKNPYKTRPFIHIGGYYHPELFWDLGFVRLAKEIQEQYNTLANTRFQNAMMSVNQMLMVRQDADIDPRSLIWKPFGIIPVEEMGDVAPLALPDMSQTNIFREQEQFFEDTLSDITGMYAYGMGQTPPRQERVGTVYSLQAVGEARIRLMLMTMDYMGFRPFLKQMMMLNTFHLPNDFETRIYAGGQDQFVPLFPGDIHPEFDFSVRYTSMEPALGKQFRLQQLIQYAQMWAQSPYLQHYQFMKSIMELMDFHNTDQYLKTPEQVAQEQAQQAQTMAQMKLMEAGVQDQLSANQQQRELTRDVVKGLMQ